VGLLTMLMGLLKAYSHKSVAQLDGIQKRSFETIISAFLLTFYDFNQNDWADSEVTVLGAERFRSNENQLRFLRGGPKRQLIMMLHGMGVVERALLLDWCWHTLKSSVSG
jgi:hypothetical protein